MNLKDTNLLDRANEIFAFPAPYAINIAQKKKRGYIQFRGHQPKHFKLVWACNYQTFFFGEESAYIHESQRPKSCTVLSLVHNNKSFLAFQEGREN